MLVSCSYVLKIDFIASFPNKNYATHTGERDAVCTCCVYLNLLRKFCHSDKSGEEEERHTQMFVLAERERGEVLPGNELVMHFALGFRLY
jgi:hypothetical protein